MNKPKIFYFISEIVLLKRFHVKKSLIKIKKSKLVKNGVSGNKLYNLTLFLEFLKF